jgi:hypothetical protein
LSPQLIRTIEEHLIALVNNATTDRLFKGIIMRQAQQNTQARRHEIHTTKKQNALAKLAAKVVALGDDALLDEYETAAYCDKSVQWLRNGRIYGGSLPYVKIGNSVRYRLADIKRQIQA